MKRVIFVYFLLFAFISPLFSQSPAEFNYQAVIRNTSGDIVANEQVSLRISLHKDMAEGQVLYSETHNVQTNYFGLVNLIIGTGESNKSISSVDWSYGNIWIKIELDINGGTAFNPVGAMKLLSVPYSRFAEKAGTAHPVLLSLSDEDRNSISNPEIGMMILNSTTNMINIYTTDGWYEVGGEKVSVEFTCGQKLSDSRDGKEYNTVQIGDQCWMAENLNVGTMITGSLDMTDNDQIEKYCYSDVEASCDTYGGLYQWNELMEYVKTESPQGICPDGWHIPSDGEVQELEMAVGMSQTLAGLSNVWRGSNEGIALGPGGDSGFDVLYSGRRVTGGMYSAINSYEYLWTSTESGSALAWRRCFRINDGRIGRYDTFPKGYGMSVRCVKN